MSRSLKALIGPSILNSDLSKLLEESQKLLDNGADYLHLDVMDGHFVPNLTFGHPIVKCLRNHIKDAFLETHMMVSKPEQAGVAIKPGTPVAEVEKYISVADMVLIMTVEPGFGGQKFMEEQMSKVQYLRKQYPLLNIEVDGGVGPSTIDCCANAGANMIVSGTAVIGAEDQAATINLLRNAVQSAIDKN